MLRDAWSVYRHYVTISWPDYRDKARSGTSLLLGRAPDGSPVATLVQRWREVTVRGRVHHVLSFHLVATLPGFHGRHWMQAVSLPTLLARRIQRPFAGLWFINDIYGASAYRSLVRTLPDTWPSWHRGPVPEHLARLVDTVMSTAEPDHWDADAGVVRWRDYVVDLQRNPREAPRADDLDDAYFLQVNPDHALGDCLVCVSSLSWMSLARGIRSTWGRRVLRLAPGWLRRRTRAARSPARTRRPGGVGRPYTGSSARRRRAG